MSKSLSIEIARGDHVNPTQEELEGIDFARGDLDLSFRCDLGGLVNLINGWLAGEACIGQLLMVVFKNPQISYRQDGRWVGCGQAFGFLTTFTFSVKTGVGLVTFQVE